MQSLGNIRFVSFQILVVYLTVLLFKYQLGSTLWIRLFNYTLYITCVVLIALRLQVIKATLSEE